MYSDPALEFFEERAAILQYDGGFSRADAEFSAVALTRRYCERTGADVPRLAYFEAFRLARLAWSDEAGKAVYVSEK